MSNDDTKTPAGKASASPAPAASPNPAAAGTFYRVKVDAFPSFFIEDSSGPQFMAGGVLIEVSGVSPVKAGELICEVLETLRTPAGYGEEGDGGGEEVGPAAWGAAEAEA